MLSIPDPGVSQRRGDTVRADRDQLFALLAACPAGVAVDASWREFFEGAETRWHGRLLLACIGVRYTAKRFGQAIAPDQVVDVSRRPIYVKAKLAPLVPYGLLMLLSLPGVASADVK